MNSSKVTKEYTKASQTLNENDEALFQKAAKDIIDIVMTLTKPKGADYAGYVMSLANDPDALKIKMADMFHNLQSSPSSRQVTKYSNVIKQLERSFGGTPPGMSDNHFSDLRALVTSLEEAENRVGQNHYDKRRSRCATG